jgi:hypothetical protein
MTFKNVGKRKEEDWVYREDGLVILSYKNLVLI